jgi:glyoxylase-like metal-dependent hydrolase (beta-lactamase superfamily II)
MQKQPNVASSRRRLRFIAGLFAVFGLLIAGLYWLTSYRPVVVVGKAPLEESYTFPAAVTGLKLHVFNTGMNRMSPLLVGSNPPWRPAPAFVIEHPENGLIVFDTGLSEAVAREGEQAYDFPMSRLIESRGDPARILDAQMRDAGLEPARVTTVILSHMHEDHIGGAAAFLNADILINVNVDKSEVADKLSANVKKISFFEAHRLAPFDASIDLFGDGSITLVYAAGHTQEDMMVILALPDGPVLLTGDAIVHRDWLASNDVERIPVDPEKAAAIRNAVRALVKQRSDFILFPGHDLRAIPTKREDIILHKSEWFKKEAWRGLGN